MNRVQERSRPVVARPVQGYSPPATTNVRVLLVCFYDPQGIATVIETVAYLQRASRHSVTVLNLFEHRRDEGTLKLHAWLNLDAFDAVVIHNTVSYNVDNLRWLDDGLPRGLRNWTGVKVLLKQDENFRFRELAQWMGNTGIDVLFTCLPPEAVSKVYPPELAGRLRVERMLTGYVTPTLRQLRPAGGERPIDIGYRGSIQPLSFGRLAFEKRTIGEDVAARLAGRGLVLDISSRWEDRLGGDAWLTFLSSCKATLGAESGASIFDLDGDLDQRLAALERTHAGEPDERRRAELVLDGLADLENNVRYHQISPRHFEAAACGALQLLFPGDYSGIFQPWRHYVPLERDFSNLEEAVGVVMDERRRNELVQSAYEEVIQRPEYWIETFVGRVDRCIEEGLAAKTGGRWSGSSAAVHALALGAGAPADSAGEIVIELIAPEELAAGGECWPRWLSGADDEAACRAMAEILWASELLRRPEQEFCDLLGAPAQSPANQRFRGELSAWLKEVERFATAASRAEGVGILCALDPAGLAAALLLKGRFGAPVAYRRCGIRTGLLEFEQQFWSGLEARLSGHCEAVLDHEADSASWAAELERLGEGVPPVPFRWAPLRMAPLAPELPPEPASPDVIRRRAVYSAMRGAWRLLPGRLQERLKPVARRLLSRL